jgi:predicted enzyme related to lactoylglutathione lyase
MSNKVRNGSSYVFDPAPLDMYDSRSSAEKGQIVVVKNIRGCPPANTMGMAHITDTDGNFLGLVCTSSLIPAR